MAFRIASTAPQSAGKTTGRVKSGDYLSWLHLLPCVVTGAVPVEAAHVSYANLHYGAPGRGKGRKVSDRWALPLSKAEHARQHSMNEAVYWREVGIDPHDLACRLWGLWSERGDEALGAAIVIVRTARQTCGFR